MSNRISSASLSSSTISSIHEQIVNRPLILGSGSASRKGILQCADIPFEIFKAEIDEKALGDRETSELAKDLVELLGNAKADAVMKVLPDHHRGKILLTADQVVTCNGKVHEKPTSVEEARSFLTLYKTIPCSTVGSIVLTDTTTGRRVSGIDTATIHYRPFPDHIIDQLIDEGLVLQCAGALMVEHPVLKEYLVRIDGTEDSVMGLSLDLLESLLKQL